MRTVGFGFVLLLLIAMQLPAADARKLARDAAKAARSGDYVTAFSLYSQAARLEPHSSYDAQSRAMLSAANRSQQLGPPSNPEEDAGDEADDLEDFSDFITDEDMAETRRPLPPLQLVSGDQRINLETRSPVKALWEEILRHYKLDVVFDDAIRDAEPISIELTGASYRDAIRLLELATNTIAYPVSESLLLIAPNDQNTQTRLEPNVAVAIQIPLAMTTEDAQEIANALRQALEIKALMVDGARRVMLVRDRYARVMLAQALAAEILSSPQDVILEIELREVNKRNLTRYGINWATNFPALVFTSWMNNTLSPVEGLNYLTFGRHPMVGIGLGAAEAVAFMSRGETRTLYRAELRSSSGRESELNLGQQYPVIQQGFLTAPTDQPGANTFFPQVQFRQLGFALKATPTVWRDTVTLDIQITVELLTGESVNGIPILSNRETITRLRLDTNQTVAVTGLLNREEAISLSGLAGLGNLPGIGALFRQTTKVREETDLLILVTPRLMHQRPVRGSSPTLYSGTATRFLAPL